MKSRFILLTIMSVLLFSGCESDDATGDIMLRLKNASNQDFFSVFVSSGGEGNTFGALSQGEYSSYETFDVAYRYGYLLVTTSSGEHTLQPTDYVGEKVLSAGSYTYEVGLTGDNVTLNFVKD